MPLTRRFSLLTSLLLSAALLVAPMPAAAADPSLGGAVTLPDGTVLPPMPVEQIVPGVQSEMLAEHGGVVAAEVSRSVQAAVADEGLTLQTANALVQAEGGFVGPGGPLPNGLRREVMGFLPYWKLDTATRASLRLDLLSTIAYFSIGVQSDGFLARGPVGTPTIGWSGWTSPALTELINAAHARGVKVVPTITMMAWDGDYSGMSTLLNSATNRARLIADVTTIIRDRGVDGVNVDFEPVPSSLRSQFTSFIRELKAGLIGAGVGSYVTVDTMAGAASWATGYDVAGLTAAGAADALMVMAYDFHYAGSARAGGVAPIESDFIYASGDALRAHLGQVDPQKLIWGVPYYGRAWNTTSDSQNATVRSPAQSVAFSYHWDDNGQPAGGKLLAQQFGRRWDATGQVPWFSFQNSDGGWRQGYYDDGASLGVKYDMVLRNGLAGIGIWHLGMDTGVSDLWDLLRSRFVRNQTRLAGGDRYATAAAVSADTFTPGVPIAYVATGASFPDALAAGPAAARGGGPVLLTGRTSLPVATANELTRLRPAQIMVLGGTGVVDDAVVAALRGYATSGVVTRLAGADRYATAAAVSDAAFFPGAPVAFVATGRDFPDALAGGAAAGRLDGPVLLVTGNGIPAATVAALEKLKPASIYVLGGSGVVGDNVMQALRAYATSGAVSRLAGRDRFATAVEISRATTFDGAANTVYIATGMGFADGLAGTPAAALADGPLIIVPSGGLTAGIAAELRRLNPARIVILGGTGAVSSTVANQIAAVWD
jgi:spore germination protein YaaH/putative cell wall-binding protein